MSYVYRFLYLCSVFIKYEHRSVTVAIYINFDCGVVPQYRNAIVVGFDGQLQGNVDSYVGKIGDLCGPLYNNRIHSWICGEKITL